MTMVEYILHYLFFFYYYLLVGCISFRVFLNSFIFTLLLIILCAWIIYVFYIFLNRFVFIVLKVDSFSRFYNLYMVICIIYILIFFIRKFFCYRFLLFSFLQDYAQKETEIKWNEFVCISYLYVWFFFVVSFNNV